MAEGVIISRSFIELVNNNRIQLYADFAYAGYFAEKTFFDKLNHVQQGMASGEAFQLGMGVEVDPESTGGLMAIQIYLDALKQNRETMIGLSKAGLNIEKQVWKNM